MFPQTVTFLNILVSSADGLLLFILVWRNAYATEGIGALLFITQQTVCQCLIAHVNILFLLYIRLSL